MLRGYVASADGIAMADTATPVQACYSFQVVPILLELVGRQTVRCVLLVAGGARLRNE